jgi:hypothetical protein
MSLIDQIGLKSYFLTKKPESFPDTRLSLNYKGIKVNQDNQVGQWMTGDSFYSRNTS